MSAQTVHTLCFFLIVSYTVTLGPAFADVTTEAIERILHRRNNAVLEQAGLGSPRTKLVLVDHDDDDSLYLASYQWTIESYSGRNERRLDSSVFRAAAALWQLILYPHGDEGHKGYISLYIGATLAPHWGPREAVHSSWRFTVMNARGKQAHVVQDAQHNFSRYSTTWGFNKLLLRQSILDPNEGWADDDGNLQLRVDVRQVVPYWEGYKGIERLHYDTVRSGVALLTEVKELGLGDVMVMYSIADDGTSRVSYSLKGKFYVSTAELRAALIAQSSALHKPLQSANSRGWGGDVGDGVAAATTDARRRTASTAVVQSHAAEAPGVPSWGLSGFRSEAISNFDFTDGSGKAAYLSMGTSDTGWGHSDSGCGRGDYAAEERTPYGSVSYGSGPGDAAADTDSRASVPGGDGPLRRGDGDASALLYDIVNGAAVLYSDDGSWDLLATLAGHVSYLQSYLSDYVTIPLAIGGVSYIAAALVLLLLRWGRALWSFARGDASAEGGGAGASGHRPKHGGAHCPKPRQQKAKPRGSGSGRRAHSTQQYPHPHPLAQQDQQQHASRTCTGGADPAATSAAAASPQSTATPVPSPAPTNPPHGRFKSSCSGAHQRHHPQHRQHQHQPHHQHQHPHSGLRPTQHSHVELVRDGASAVGSSNAARNVGRISSSSSSGAGSSSRIAGSSSSGAGSSSRIAGSSSGSSSRLVGNSSSLARRLAASLPWLSHRDSSFRSTGSTASMASGSISSDAKSCCRATSSSSTTSTGGDKGRKPESEPQPELQRAHSQSRPQLQPRRPQSALQSHHSMQLPLETRDDDGPPGSPSGGVPTGALTVEAPAAVDAAAMCAQAEAAAPAAAAEVAIPCCMPSHMRLGAFDTVAGAWGAVSVAAVEMPAAGGGAPPLPQHRSLPCPAVEGPDASSLVLQTSAPTATRPRPPPSPPTQTPGEALGSGVSGGGGGGGGALTVVAPGVALAPQAATRWAFGPWHPTAVGGGLGYVAPDPFRHWSLDVGLGLLATAGEPLGSPWQEQQQQQRIFQSSLDWRAQWKCGGDEGRGAQPLAARGSAPQPFIGCDVDLARQLDERASSGGGAAAVAPTGGHLISAAAAPVPLAVIGGPAVMSATQYGNAYGNEYDCGSVDVDDDGDPSIAARVANAVLEAAAVEDERREGVLTAHGRNGTIRSDLPKGCIDLVIRGDLNQVCSSSTGTGPSHCASSACSEGGGSTGTVLGVPSVGTSGCDGDDGCCAGSGSSAGAGAGANSGARGGSSSSSSSSEGSDGCWRSARGRSGGGDRTVHASGSGVTVASPAGDSRTGAVAAGCTGAPTRATAAEIAPHDARVLMALRETLPTAPTPAAAPGPEDNAPRVLDGAAAGAKVQYEARQAVGGRVCSQPSLAAAPQMARAPAAWLGRWRAGTWLQALRRRVSKWVAAALVWVAQQLLMFAALMDADGARRSAPLETLALQAAVQAEGTDGVSAGGGTAPGRRVTGGCYR